MHERCQDKDTMSDDYMICMNRAAETRQWLFDKCACIDAAQLLKDFLLEECRDLETPQEKVACKEAAKEAFKLDRSECQERLKGSSYWINYTEP